MAPSAVYDSEEDLIAWMKEIQYILSEQDLPLIDYGQLKWDTVLRSDIQGFVPNPLHLNACNFGHMSREPSARSPVEQRR
jgi:hypothetical protein